MRFNEAKLIQLIERAEQLHAALLDVTDRRRELQRSRDVFRMTIIARDREPTYAEAAELERMNDQIGRLAEQQDAAAEKWESAARLASNLKRYARDHLSWCPEGPGRVRLPGFMGGVA